MLYEFREYTCLPGKRDAWVTYMHEVVVPFQTSKGVVVIGMWTSETNSDVYYWMRRFEDEAERVRIYEAVYKNATWVNDIGPVVGTFIDRSKIVVTRMNSTGQSII